MLLPVVKAEVATGAIHLKADLGSRPQALALDQNSQHVKGLLRPPQLAIALENHNVTVMSLDDGTVLKTFSSRYVGMVSFSHAGLVYDTIPSGPSSGFMFRNRRPDTDTKD